jgi:hypothetical protein
VTEPGKREQSGWLTKWHKLARKRGGREGFRRGKVRNTPASTHGQGSHGVNRNLRCAERGINYCYYFTSMDERTSSSWHGTSRRYAHKRLRRFCVSSQPPLMGFQFPRRLKVLLEQSNKKNLMNLYSPPCPYEMEPMPCHAVPLSRNVWISSSPRRPPEAKLGSAISTLSLQQLTQNGSLRAAP